MRIKHTRHNVPSIHDDIERIVEDVLKKYIFQLVDDFLLWSIETNIRDDIHDELEECTINSIITTYGSSGFYVTLDYLIEGDPDIHYFKTLIPAS